MKLIRKTLFVALFAVFTATAMAQDPAISSPGDPATKASQKVKFELGLEMLRGYRADLQDRLEKSVGLLVIVIGWLITSETARKSLAANSFLWWGSVVVLTALLIMYCATIFNFIDNFRKIENTIQQLGYIDSGFELTRYRMPDKFYFPVQSFYIGPIAAMYVVIILILIQIKRHSGSFTR